MSSTPNLISALLGSDVMQRLHGVSQAGAPVLHKKTRSSTRFEHSVGVWALANQLDLPLERQVIALLHDATHTAFSHTADYLFRNRAEDSHERQLGRLLSDNQLSRLITPDELRPMLTTITERPYWLKMLDALDYTTRDLECAGLLTATDRAKLHSQLVASPEGPTFLTQAAARSFLNYMECAAVKLYCDPFDLFLHHTLAALMAAAMDAGVLSMETVMAGQDEDVLAQLRTDPKFSDRLDAFLGIEPEDLVPTGERIFSKPRIIIPLVIVAGRDNPVPLHELEPEWLDYVADAKARAAEGVPLLALKPGACVAKPGL